jgi:NADH dehydrogenase
MFSATRRLRPAKTARRCRRWRRSRRSRVPTWNRGNTAIVGRNAAVFDFGRVHLKGRLAWMLWALVHIYLLVGFENRLRVSLEWFWRYITYESGARLIMPPRAGPKATDQS